MNVLFVASDNNYTSGAFLSMVKLCELLRDRHEVNPFVVLPNEGDGEPLLQKAGIPYRIIPSRNWVVDIEDGKTEFREQEKEKELFGNEAAIKEIEAFIKDMEIDLAHINTSYSYVGAKAAIRAGIPYIWHIREFLEEDQNRKIWNREKGYALMSGSSRVITISYSLYKKYEKILPKEKLVHIDNGIDENYFWDEKHTIFQDEYVKLSIIGGIVPHKGHEELLRALGQVKSETLVPFVLRIIGKERGAYREILNSVIEEEGIGSHILFMGPTDDVPNVLKDTDILFICSRNEAFGRVTVEGMMSGCLVIGADTAGTKEIIENEKTGFLYHQGDVESLAQIVIKALKNRDLAQKLAASGRQKAKDRYTAARNADEVYSVYEKVLENV